MLLLGQKKVLINDELSQKLKDKQVKNWCELHFLVMFTFADLLTDLLYVVPYTLNVLISPWRIKSIVFKSAAAFRDLARSALDVLSLCCGVLSAPVALFHYTYVQRTLAEIWAQGDNRIQGDAQEPGGHQLEALALKPNGGTFRPGNRWNNLQLLMFLLLLEQLKDMAMLPVYVLILIAYRPIHQMRRLISLKKLRPHQFNAQRVCALQVLAVALMDIAIFAMGTCIVRATHYRYGAYRDQIQAKTSSIKEKYKNVPDSYIREVLDLRLMEIRASFVYALRILSDVPFVMLYGAMFLLMHHRYRVCPFRKREILVNALMGVADYAVLLLFCLVSAGGFWRIPFSCGLVRLLISDRRDLIRLPNDQPLPDAQKGRAALFYKYTFMLVPEVLLDAAQICVCLPLLLPVYTIKEFGSIVRSEGIKPHEWRRQRRAALHLFQIIYYDTLFLKNYLTIFVTRRYLADLRKQLRAHKDSFLREAGGAGPLQQDVNKRAQCSVVQFHKERYQISKQFSTRLVDKIKQLPHLLAYLMIALLMPWRLSLCGGQKKTLRELCTIIIQGLFDIPCALLMLLVFATGVWRLRYNVRTLKQLWRGGQQVINPLTMSPYDGGNRFANLQEMSVSALANLLIDLWYAPVFAAHAITVYHLLTYRRLLSRLKVEDWDFPAQRRIAVELLSLTWLDLKSFALTLPVVCTVYKLSQLKITDAQYQQEAKLIAPNHPLHALLAKYGAESHLIYFRHVKQLNAQILQSAVQSVLHAAIVLLDCSAPDIEHASITERLRRIYHSLRRKAHILVFAGFFVAVPWRYEYLRLKYKAICHEKQGGLLKWACTFPAQILCEYLMVPCYVLAFLPVYTVGVYRKYCSENQIRADDLSRLRKAALLMVLLVSYDCAILAGRCLAFLSYYRRRRIREFLAHIEAKHADTVAQLLANKKSAKDVYLCESLVIGL